MSKSPKGPLQIRSTAEFARYVGLSRSAVSRVLNNQQGLKQETIDRVKKAMDETGFTQNAHALHLRGKSPSMIGVCMENFITPPSVSKLSVLQNLLRDKGYSSLIEVLKPGTSQKVVRHFLSLRVDGIIFIGHFPPEELQERVVQLNRNSIPNLVVDNLGVQNANTVSLDRVGALVKVTDHLLDLGHRRFGLLGISGSFQTIADRLKGIRQALEKRGLDIATCVKSLDYLHQMGEHFQYGSMLARSFAKMPDMPTAFIAVDDETAIGAMLEFQALGLRIPEDLSIVGFNNQNICLMTRPLLTSVDQQIDRSMEVAADAILSQISHTRPGKFIEHTIDSLLIERGTTGPVPTRNRVV